MTPDSDHFTWQAGPLRLAFSATADAPVRLTGLHLQAGTELVGFVEGDACPLVEVDVLGQGPADNRMRNLATSVVGSRLRHVGHREHSDTDGCSLTVEQLDPETGLHVTTTFSTDGQAAALRVHSTLANHGNDEVVIEAATALVLGALAWGEPDASHGLVLHQGRSSWTAENRWQARDLYRDAELVVHTTAAGDVKNFPETAVVQAVGTSTWSTDGVLPCAALEDARTERCVMWQVEASGLPWVWEVQMASARPAAVTIACSGPTSLHHTWHKVLPAGQEWTSPAASFSLGEDFGAAIQAMTRHRRWIAGTRRGEQHAPRLVFNDYMNTLDGDPTVEKLEPLIDAAAAIGAEFFCIDAGWYDDGTDWWPSVGEWLPATTRFNGPDGLQQLLDRIRDLGMVPGLWLEPESIGTRSRMVDELGPTALLQRHGVPVVTKQRHLLDFRNPQVIEHLDRTVDRLVGWGVGMFKFDHNVTAGVGSDLGGPAEGCQLAEHVRAYLDWVDGLRERHPELILENCGSGAMRQDFGQVRHFDLQSTSDQEDTGLYTVVAAGSPMMLPSELAANWAYPSAGMGLEETIATMVVGLSGRLYQSGRLDRLSPEQIALVTEGATYFKSRRDQMLSEVPWWPLGIPHWHAELVVLGQMTPDGARIFAWNRAASPHEVRIPAPRGVAFTRATPGYPAGAVVDLTTTPDELVINLPPGLCGRVIEVRWSPKPG